ncbi:hypothetical protein C0J52_05544 [Blattella germanica]|nr:hypothetical protein C0J52_05544 [Blattella germanica]
MHGMYPRNMVPHCFVCDEEIVGRGVPLLMSHTSCTKTGLPTKIGQLMGDGFMVVVSIEDMLCKRCNALLNQLDQLEADLDVLKSVLTDYLKIKYGLLNEMDELDTQNSIMENKDDSDGSEPELEPLSTVDNGNKTIEILLDKDSNVTKDKINAEPKDVTKSESNPSKLYKCTICSFKTSDSSTLQSHFLTCSELPYKCTICEKRFESHKYVRNHIMETHLSNWTCHFCNKTFAEEKEFTNHMKEHLGNNSTISKIPMEESPNASGDDSYDLLQNMHGSFECNICDYQCTNKKVFDDHVRKHIALKLFQCKICKEKFPNEADLNKHIQDHKPELFKCEQCNAEFDKKESYTEHMQTHFGVMDIKTETLENLVNENSIALETVLNASAEDNGNTMITEPPDKPDLSSCLENKRNEIEFHTCHICSLTFVNEFLFIEHTKMHKQNEPSKELFSQDANQLLQMGNEDSTEHDVNSIDSEGRQQYLEMDDSLEDMFEKLHAETEKVAQLVNINCNEKKVLNQEMLPQNSLTSYKCSFCQAEFMNDDDLQLHQVTEMHLESVPDCETVRLPIMVADKTGIHIQDRIRETNNCEQNQMTLNNSESLPIEITNTTLLMEHHNQNIADNLKDMIMQGGPSVMQESENAKDGFIDIFDMVREKKLASNDDAIIDHNLLQTMCESEIKNDQNKLMSSPLDLNPFDAPNLKQLSDNMFNTAPAPSKKTYVCAMCGFRTPVMHDLRIHFKKHKQKSFQCAVCKKSYPSSQKLTNHLRVHEKFRGKMTCPYCYEEFPDKLRLQQHLQDKHQKEKVMYKCAFCNETFNTKKAYKAHEEVHPERFSFKCDECDQPFMKEKQLLDHKDAVHRDPHCRFCGKEIVKAKTLRNHELRHIREKDSFECDICKRVFKTKTGLRHHVAVHTGEYKYCCDYCGRGFMSRMMMEEHRSMHTKEERYICDVCGRKFSFQSTYWIHRKWHDNPYPYKCSYCGRMFRHSSLLAVHKRKHTGERPYKCPQCPLSFPVGGTLKRHLILHTGVYPFNCESCKRGFTTRHKYATHLAKIHSDFELLHAKPQQSEYKMVIRDEPKFNQQQSIWEVADDSVTDQITFKLEDDGSKDAVGDGIACTIVSDDMLVDNIVPTRVVEIVLDEASQAVATVTLAEHANILPDIWYQ